MSNNLGDGQRTDCTGIIYISENLSGFFLLLEIDIKSYIDFWYVLIFTKKTAVKPGKS